MAATRRRVPKVSEARRRQGGSLPASRQARGLCEQQLGDVEAPTMTFSSQYRSTSGNTSSRGPASHDGSAFATRRTSRKGQAMLPGATSRPATETFLSHKLMPMAEFCRGFAEAPNWRSPPTASDRPCDAAKGVVTGHAGTTSCSGKPLPSHLGWRHLQSTTGELTGFLYSRRSRCCSLRSPSAILPRLAPVERRERLGVYYGLTRLLPRERPDSHSHRVPRRPALPPGLPEQRARGGLILVAFVALERGREATAATAVSLAPSSRSTRSPRVR